MDIAASTRIPAIALTGVSPAARRKLDEVEEFVQNRCIPAETVFAQQLGVETKQRFATHHSIVEDLKEEARSRGLWNLFMAKEYCEDGAGFSNLEYALMAEQLGQSFIASECMNCSAPDTGNMEVLLKYGNLEQKKEWLQPLIDGEIRSAFLMSEPDVASSDATNIQFDIKRDGKDYILNGSKWWSSGAGDPRCELYIVMGKTDPCNPNPHRQQSVILVPSRTAGITVHRMLSVFGYDDAPHGHGHITFDNVRVPTANLVLDEGRGFEIIQGRLGPGRIHHAMRCIGVAERALNLMVSRAAEPKKKPFGKMLSQHDIVMARIARARAEIDAARLVVLNAALKIDNGDPKSAIGEIAEAKILVPEVLLRVLDDAIQLFGAAGVSQDTPLAYMWASARTMRLVDGPDEVHLLQLAKRETRRASVIRQKQARQETIMAEICQDRGITRVDPLHLGWTAQTKPRL
ncbi:unnamed protein product [Clonostachys byssicola]|uniref:Acyl-CoA dehydrogenase NM domain-like protein n=1 Tax=Clonostachys byssicola TaxID=160290 RepID=A0A9N9UI66_9HYPO|nr:unnamed protein product [Clonostachys byssicola]